MSKTKTIDEIRLRAIGTITTLEALCDSYDRGNFHSSRTIAVEIYRLLSAELVHYGIRRKIRWLDSSIIQSPGYTYAMPLNVVDITQSGAVDYIHIQFNPAMVMPSEYREKACRNAFISFNDWWNGIVIEEIKYQTTAKITTAVQSRRNISRHGAIEMLRNKSGAHYDANADNIELIRNCMGTRWPSALIEVTRILKD